MTTKQVRQVGADEAFERKTVVDGEKVLITRAVKPSERSSDRYLVEATLDFSKVSHEDRLTLAASTAWIALQRRWRAAFAENPTTALDASQWSNIDVQAELVDNAGRNLDPKTKALRALDKLDDAAKDEVIKRYLAEQKKGKKAA